MGKLKRETADNADRIKKEVGMKTIMDVEVGSKEDDMMIKYCYDVSVADPMLYERGRALVNKLALGGFWKGYFAALYEVLKALQNEKGGHNG